MHTRKENIKNIKSIWKYYRPAFPGTNRIFFNSSIQKEGDFSSIMYFEPEDYTFHTNTFESHPLSDFTDEEIDTLAKEMINCIAEYLEHQLESAKKNYNSFVKTFFI